MAALDNEFSDDSNWEDPKKQVREAFYDEFEDFDSAAYGLVVLIKQTRN